MDDWAVVILIISFAWCAITVYGIQKYVHCMNTKYLCAAYTSIMETGGLLVKYFSDIEERRRAEFSNSFHKTTDS